MNVLNIVFKVFIVVLTVYLMAGFILNKICELKNDRWHNFNLYKPDEDIEYIVVTKDMKIKVDEYDSKNFEFKNYEVISWRELPPANDVIAKIQKNPFGFRRYINDKKKNR